MLVLTRRQKQTVVIGNDLVRFTILSINNKGEVRVGIEADKAISIHREEIYKRVKCGEASKSSSAKPQTIAPVLIVPMDVKQIK
ncbi:carbon storage regulator [Microbulbifer sp. 2201CG32-9]|uniref:carbon storage regulator n=1 Tax=Microbulbifer sp. 2201CG32-9 TaxID=3232309 RepID=UPI00345C15B4